MFMFAPEVSCFGWPMGTFHWVISGVMFGTETIRMRWNDSGGTYKDIKPCFKACFKIASLAITLLDATHAKNSPWFHLSLPPEIGSSLRGKHRCGKWWPINWMNYLSQWWFSTSMLLRPRVLKKNIVSIQHRSQRVSVPPLCSLRLLSPAW